MNQKCKLCLSTEELQESQIIPQSIFNVFKNEELQSATIVSDLEKLKIYSLSPKDKLLCQQCEDFLAKTYHKFNAQLFNNPQQTQIEFSNIEYEKFYLYLVSILWLSSVSSLTEYSEIDFPSDLEGILQVCIRDQTMQLDDVLSIDNFFKISISRLVDSTSRFEDRLINQLITTFIQTVNENDETVFYFIADGYLIEYVFAVDFIEQEPLISSESLQSQTTILPILNAEITRYPELIDLINELPLKD